MADLSKLSDEELLALYQRMRAEPKAGGVSQAPQSSAGGTLFDSIKESAPAALIGLGRTGDKTVAGMQQLNNSIEAIKAEVTGGNSKPYLQELANLEKTQAGNDVAYAPLKAEFPKATAVGENLPLAFTPMGQATTGARIAAPAIAGAVMQGLQYGDPKQRGLASLRGGGEGLVGGAVGEVMRRFIQPIPGVMGSQAQEEARKAAAAIPDARLLPSQMTGSPGMRAMEDMLAQSPGGRGPIAQQVRGTSAALTRHYLRGVGIDGDTATPDVLAEAASRISGDYKRLAPGVKLDVNQSALDAVDKAEKFLLKGDTSGSKAQALATVQSLKNQLYGMKSMPGEDWGVWQSDLGAMARSTENNQVATTIRNLREELNNLARGPAAQEWKQVDRRNAMLETLFRPNVVNKEGQVNPAAVHRILSSDFGKTYLTGGLKSEAADVGRFGATVPNLREGSQTFGRGEMDSLYGLGKAMLKYPAAKAITSPAFQDWLSKGLLASPEASSIGAGLLGGGTVPLVVGPVDLGLRSLLFQ